MAPKNIALMRLDPFTLLRQMASDLDRPFEGSGWPSFRWPSFRALPTTGDAAWYPQIDVFERDGRLVTKIDLPGIKKEDVKVEVTDGHLAISGERKSEAEEKKAGFYRCERQYRQLLPGRAAARRGEDRRREGGLLGRRARGQRAITGEGAGETADCRDSGRAEGGQECRVREGP